MNMAAPLMADAISELNTRGNRLSLWRLANRDPAQQDALLAAMIGRRANLQALDLAFLPDTITAELGIEFDPDASGESPHAEANRMHIDLVNLTASKLVSVGERVLASLRTGVGTAWVRIDRHEVARALDAELEAGRVDRQELNADLLSDLVAWKQKRGAKRKPSG